MSKLLPAEPESMARCSDKVMFRTGLIIAFVVATLANPLVCCCTAGPRVGPETRATKPSHSGCCSQRHFGGVKHDVPCQRDKGPCRCREHVKNAVTAELSDALLQLLLRPTTALFLDPGIATFSGCPDLLAVEVPAIGTAVAFPHLTVRGILRALQTLRC